MLVLRGQGVQKNLRKRAAWGVAEPDEAVVPPRFALETVSIHPVAVGCHGVCGTHQEQQAEVITGWLDCP